MEKAHMSKTFSAVDEAPKFCTKQNPKGVA
jgi:hypothetical protein